MPAELGFYADRQAPSRTILFSSYFDATAATREQDYGNFTAILAEDFYFSSASRCIALGRLRREVRNNPYLAGLVAKYPEAIGYSVLRSTSSSKEYNATKQAWWRQLARRITSDGRSLRTLEKILKTELLLAGELFLVKRAGGAIQPIASEFCGTPASSPVLALPDGGREINGIGYDADNRVRYYRFGKMTGAGLVVFGETEIVPAEFVIHVFDPDRVQQGRGLPWLLPSLRTARDLYEITRSKTKQIKDANTISGFIEKQGAADFLKSLDAPELDDDARPKTEKPSDPADKIGKTGPVVVELKPGTFVALEPGEKINTLMSHYSASDYKELIMLMLHAMSTPVGMPVELWFSGLGDVNYSGYKGLGVQWDGRRQDVIEFLVSTFYDPLHAWLAGLDTALGDLPPHPDSDTDLVEWVFRRTPVLDDEKSGKSNKIKLESGEADLAEIWAERGYAEEEVFARRRQLWIKLRVAAGELPEAGDHEAEKVPLIFLLRGLLPGEKPIPPGDRAPATGTDPLADPATEPVDPAAQSTPAKK